MRAEGWITLVVMVWLVWVLVSNRIVGLSVRGTLDSGAVLLGFRVYSRLVHRLAISEGADRIPKKVKAGPLIVVCNHTAGVDPILVQSKCPFEITWTMAQDMRVPVLEPFWIWSRMLFVDRKGGGSRGARQALRLLAEGGVLGIFPEGRLERPMRRLLPFHAGVGLLTVKSGATVLPIVIEGTPDVASAWASLWTPSRARLRVLEPIVYDAATRPAHVVRDLQSRFANATGWPVADVSKEGAERCSPASAAH